MARYKSAANDCNLHRNYTGLLRPGLLQRQGVVGVALSISAQRFIFRSTRAEYGSKGCAVTAAGIKGGAGQSTLEVGKVVAQPARSITGSSGSHLGRLGSFGRGIQGSYHLGGLAALVGAVGCGLDADLIQALVLCDRVLAGVPFDSGCPAGHKEADRNDDLDQDAAHARSTIPTWVPLSVMVMTRLMERSGTCVDTCTH